MAAGFHVQYAASDGRARGEASMEDRVGWPIGGSDLHYHDPISRMKRTKRTKWAEDMRGRRVTPQSRGCGGHAVLFASALGRLARVALGLGIVMIAGM